MIWVRSSVCESNSCVEVGVWNKSSFSNNGGQCVDVSGTDTEILVRDSKDPDGPVLRFSFEEWEAFLGEPGKGGAKGGEFDIKRPAAQTVVPRLT